MTATKFRGSIHSSFFHKGDDPRSHSTKPLRNIWEKPPYVVPSSNWGGIRNEWIHGISHQETHFGTIQQFRVAGGSQVRAGSRSSEFLDAVNLVYDRWAPSGSRLNVPKTQPPNVSGVTALRIGGGKSAVHLDVVHSMDVNTIALEHCTNLFRSTMEAAATDFAGQASMRGLGTYMVPSQRLGHIEAGWALAGRVEDDHEVPNVISLKGSSGTRVLPMSALVDYFSRIQELRSFGEEEDITVSRDSESDFWRFVFQFPSEQPGNLMLLQDGHLRWIWKGDGLTHVGIRFIGHGRGWYVIFKRRPGEFHVSRVSGEDNLEGVVQQVRSFGMTLFGNDNKQAD